MDENNIIRLVRQEDLQSQWLARCINGNSGKPLAILANALIALRAEMNGAFTYDEMLGAPILMRSMAAEEGFRPRPLSDVVQGLCKIACSTLGSNGSLRTWCIRR